MGQQDWNLLGKHIFKPNAPIDARELVNSDSDIVNIDSAYVGMIVTVNSNPIKRYKIKKVTWEGHPDSIENGGYELIQEPKDLKYSDGVTPFLNNNGNIDADYLKFADIDGSEEEKSTEDDFNVKTDTLRIDGTTYENSKKLSIRNTIGALENITSMQNVQPVIEALNNRTAKIDQQTSEIIALGYKVLNPNLSFAEQVNSANTIYEIKDSFDLNNGNVTIPTGCTLKFNGGMLKNGNVNASTLNIISNNKCFSEITFSGNCLKSVIYLSWFISDYPKFCGDYSVDNTTDIENCLNLGFYGVIFPNDRYLHVSRTIVVNGDSDIIVENNKHAIQRIRNNREDRVEQPCIFTKTAITVFSFVYTSLRYKQEFHIGALNIYNFTPFNDLSLKNTPVISITNNSNIWGLEIDSNISVCDCQLTVNNVTEYFGNYTGIKIFTTNNYISIIRINGTINQTHKAISIEKADNSDGWITDTIINSDTISAIGGEFYGGAPIRIFGSHQTLAAFDNQNESYFKGKSIFLYGYVWDLEKVVEDTTTGSRIYGVVYAIDPDNELSSINHSSTFINNKDSIKYKNTSKVFKTNNPEIGDFKNVLDLIIRGYWLPSILSAQRLSISYTIDGTDILTTKSSLMPNLYNRHHLFNTDFTFGNVGLQYKDTECCYIVGNNNKAIVCNISFLVPEVGKWFFRYKYGNLLNQGSVYIKEHDAEDFIFKETRLYTPDNEYILIALENTKRYDFALSISDADTIVFPSIALLTNIKIPYGDRPMLFPTIYRPIFGPDTNTAKQAAGFSYFDFSTGDVKYWDGNKYIDFDRATAGVKRSGTSTQRPLQDNIYVGFKYFDTTLGKPVFWNGSTWVNSNGEAVGLQVSDTSVLIGAAADSSVTINVYHANALTVSALNPDNTPATWLTVPDNIAVGTNTLTITANSANTASNPRGAKVIIEDGTDVVIVNVVQNYATT